MQIFHEVEGMSDETDHERAYGGRASDSDRQRTTSQKRFLQKHSRKQEYVIALTADSGDRYRTSRRPEEAVRADYCRRKTPTDRRGPGKIAAKDEVYDNAGAKRYSRRHDEAAGNIFGRRKNRYVCNVRDRNAK